MHHVELTSSMHASRTKTAGFNSLTGNLDSSVTIQLSDSNDAHSNLSTSIVLQNTDKEMYNGILGSVTFRKKTKYSRRSRDQMQQTDLVLEEDLIMITSSFFRRSFELRISNSFGWASRSLKMYPVMMEDAPVFRMCQKGDIEGLQVAFSRRDLSPFVLDNHGRTLLHVSHAAKFLQQIRT